jgi:N6-L-threonylcarbamoyladenine synthase
MVNLVSSQEIHAKYGGVVPEVAAREHSVTLPPLLFALAEKVTGEPDGRKLGKVVDRIAVTRGPGLVTSLRVGADTARTLAAAWGKRIIGVNHIAGHVYSNWLPQGEGGQGRFGAVAFPALILVVSGGHTELLFMTGHGRYRLLGSTRDDAAGEAFDKAAKMMGLGYPGGPALSRAAEQGDPEAVDFPRPMLNDPHLDFSFSGLKTAVRYHLQKNRDRLAEPGFVADTAASVEQAIVDVLIAKTMKAAEEARPRAVLLAGGVAANRKLRETLSHRVTHETRARIVIPPLEYCTDNAAMIAMAGYFAPGRLFGESWKRMEVDPGWELGR